MPCALGCECCGYQRRKCRSVGGPKIFSSGKDKILVAEVQKVEPKITDEGKKTNTNYVDSDGDRSESLE